MCLHAALNTITCVHIVSVGVSVSAYGFKHDYMCQPLPRGLSEPVLRAIALNNSARRLQTNEDVKYVRLPSVGVQGKQAQPSNLPLFRPTI